MIWREAVIGDALGLHARKAARFAAQAETFTSDIRMTFKGVRVDGKSILDLMMLGAARGDRVIIEVEGPDQQPALERLSALLEQGGKRS